MIEKLSPSDRRGIAAAFATACLSFIAWAYPNTTRLITIPGAIACACLTVYFLWPEIKALFDRFRRKRDMPLTSDIAYNGALVATFIAWVAAILKGRNIAVAAALIATIAVGLDYWLGPPRFFFWQKPDLADFLGLKGSPLSWSQLYINNTVLAPSEKPMSITEIDIMGGNRGDQEIKLEDAYFISEMDGSRLDVTIGLGGTHYKIRDINPITPKTLFFVASDPIGPKNLGLSQEEFLRKWGTVAFIARYDGVDHRILFDREAVKAVLPKPLEPTPHISPKIQH